MSSAPKYLRPYQRACRAHGDGFRTLLWASPESQAARFQALARHCTFAGMNVLDVGCGRADFLDFLIARQTPPAHYTGIEAVPELAEAALRKTHENAIIIQDDFVAHPTRMLVGADVVVICGSLNTLTETQFYDTLTIACDAAAQALAFNFLCSSQLAAADWLTWHRRDKVLDFARRLCPSVVMDDSYVDGDCTIVMRKHERAL
ncbi:MAG: class I SAM-dependent methyltransferase [Tepidisphaeraceae bacterium]|jgi:SAM-dependent methyltransferase